MTRFALSVLAPSTLAIVAMTAAAAAPAAPAAPMPQSRPAATRPAATRPAAATTQASSSTINAAANPIGAIEDAKASFEKGDYPETLRVLGRVLSLKGKAADGIDRYELFMLRAEAQLHTKAQAAAVQALEDAAKIAKAAKDDKRLADARVLSILIKRSKSLQFTPKVQIDPAAKGTPAGIDIVDAKPRLDALKALYLEEKVAAKPKVQGADKARTLPPVATALKAVLPLRDFELAATGGDGETKEQEKQLVDKVHTLIAKGLDDMTKRVTKLTDHASELITYTVLLRDGSSDFRTRRRGIETQDRNELKDIVKTCDRVAATCRELTEDFDAGKPFEDLEDQARDTTERANDLLKEDFSK